MQEKVIIASGNPVKINATKEAFLTVFPGHSFVFEGIPVGSGVPDQPRGIDQTLKGAFNRVQNLKARGPKAAYYVGIEGGIVEQPSEWFAFAWMYIESGTGQVGKAQTGHFALPPRVIHWLEQGLELGEANDRVFGQENSKQKSGAVGLLTKDIIDRSEYYRHALILALIPFLRKDLYENESKKVKSE